MKRKHKFNFRYAAMALILAAFMILFSLRTAQIDISKAEYYLNQAETVSSKTVTIKAARGEILDRYGRPLAINRQGYDVVFNYAALDKDQFNATLVALTNLLTANGETWFDNLPLAADAPYGFTENESAVSGMRKLLELAHYATAENCYVQMVDRYDLAAYDTATQRTLMGIRYSMELADFSITNPYTFAEDISTETMTAISESGFDLPGVEITVVPVREYTDTSVAPHILGTTGPIYAEDWATLKEQGYSYNDKVGKSGIESYAESFLRGTDGKKIITTDSSGAIVSTEITTEAVAGDTVYLSIDKNLQITAQEGLASLIKSISTASAGAVVVVSCKTGEVLASANYPSYDMKDYMDNYTALANDAAKPLFDRAFRGQYPPGSAFKPAVALAGLNEGIITASSLITCTHRYTYYQDYQPTCLGRHGSINVITALSKSCNFFFYDVGRRLGISKIDEYCTQLGLGIKTGVEIGETAGILAGPEYREQIGSYWTGGDTIQAAIGQSDNAFSPLQLAMYTATIANDGTRYQARLIHQITSQHGDVVQENISTVAMQMDVSSSAFATVKQGMLSVTEDGTGSATFGSYAIKVGGKTGTAQTTSGEDHSVFVAFAPYEDPEIAVSVLVEHGGHGSSSTTLVRSIFDAYFFSSGDPYTQPAYNTLLQ